MNTTGLEKLSENEMSQIKGGEGYWVLWNGEWRWVNTYDLDDEDYENMQPSSNGKDYSSGKITQ